MTEETKKFARYSGEFEDGSVQIEDFEFYACLPKKLADLINAAHEKAVAKAWEDGRRSGFAEAVDEINRISEGKKTLDSAPEQCENKDMKTTAVATATRHDLAR